jgi:TPR repeat protein
MFLRFPIALVLSIVCLATPAWADFQAGMDAYARGDCAIAMQEWRPLAEKGDANAQYNLIGVLYHNGHGMPHDYGLARHWWEQDAAQGNAMAQVNLGTLYLEGMGVSEDYQMALFWFCLAANQEDALAQAKLGVMYQRGNGVPQDFVQAHMWFNLSETNGEKIAAEFRDALTKQMTPSQIAEAQRLVREWKPKTP